MREHLRHASQASHFDAYTEHVFANMLVELANLSSGDKSDSKIRALCDALEVVERAILAIGASEKNNPKFTESLRAIHELENKIFNGIESIDKVQELAEVCFQESKSQGGFVVAGRRMLFDANHSNKGQDWKAVRQYIDAVITRLNDANSPPSPELINLRVDLTIRWRLQEPRGPIDWAELRKDLEDLLRTPKYRDDFTKLYYYGLSLYHLNDLGPGRAVLS